MNCSLQIRHSNIYFVDNPKKAAYEVTFVIQDIKMMVTEKGIPDINAIFRGLLTTVIGIHRRFAHILFNRNLAKLKSFFFSLNTLFFICLLQN